jgi:uncharacterized SAM-binding protein YcdF (DUF218 family)
LHIFTKKVHVASVHVGSGQCLHRNGAHFLRDFARSAEWGIEEVRLPGDLILKRVLDGAFVEFDKQMCLTFLHDGEAVRPMCPFVNKSCEVGAVLYVIKAVVGWILPPGLFVLALAVVALVLWKRSRRYSIVLACTALVLYLCSIPLVAYALVRPLEQKYAPPKEVQGDVIVMLGGGATPDTPDVGGTGMLSGSAANRLLTVARLYRETRLPIILSGGQVFPDDGVESEIARRQLMALGVPSDAIFVENQSRNTEENAKYTKSLLERHGFRRPILVTSAFHMRRSVIDFANVGVSVVPYPTDYQTSVHPYWYPSLLVPNGYSLFLVWTALHEYLGIAEAKFS